MKVLTIVVTLLMNSMAFAGANEDCLSGKFATCREIFNKYGSQSDRAGAVELFDKACSSQNLRVTCEVISSVKSETLKKALERAKPDAGSFIINGPKLDKIYQISELK